MFPRRQILGKQLVTKHVSWDMKIKYVSTETASWKPTRYGTRFLRYESEICIHGVRFLETNSLRNTFPAIRKWNMFPRRQILGNQYVTEHVSRYTKMKYVSTETDSWKPTRYGTRFLKYKNKICFHGDRFLETNSLRNTFPAIRIWNIFPRRRILGNQCVT
jgi:hypothetical protein